MKKLFCLAVLCFALFICGCGQETPPAESQVQESSVTVKQPVQWKDETVRKLVYDELNRDYSEDVYPYELENISCLYIIGDKKISFNGRPAGGIEPEKPYEIKFSGVLRTENGYERVDTVFTDTAEMCLDDLVHFTGLTDLFVHLVKPEDLSFLSSLPQLDTLGMGCCELDSLE
ncbi:MAG: hypothetical protein IJD80_02960, partial [Oscillospiraceae bacterium]|nr:hypothetical protein [Oscillospiraceae bacterium]